MISVAMTVNRRKRDGVTMTLGNDVAVCENDVAAVNKRDQWRQCGEKMPID